MNSQQWLKTAKCTRQLQGLSRWEGQTIFFLIKPDRMSEQGLSPLLSSTSQARKFQECESSHRMGHSGHSGCALLKRWRCSVRTDEQCRRAKLPPRGTHTLSLIMEGFLHPLEYRWSAWASKKPVSSQTLLWKQGELKRAGWGKGAEYTVAKFHHLTLPQADTDVQVKTLTLEMWCIKNSTCWTSRASKICKGTSGLFL